MLKEDTEGEFSRYCLFVDLTGEINERIAELKLLAEQ